MEKMVSFLNTSIVLVLDLRQIQQQIRTTNTYVVSVMVVKENVAVDVATVMVTFWYSDPLNTVTMDPNQNNAYVIPS